MSKELYPTNSTIIDLRNKISSVKLPSKTKQFVGDLNRFSGTPSMPMDHINQNRTYESERWYSPRPDDEMNVSLPPKRSMFTPSRLQNLSALRSREAKKPYWRCPLPSTKSSTSSASNALSNIERIIQNYSSTNDNYISKEPAITVTPAPMKSFVRRREPEIGKKTNMFNVDDVELTIEQDNTKNVENDLGKVQAPTFSAKPGFIIDFNKQITGEDVNNLDASNNDLVFTFGDPMVRQPKSPTPPPKLIPIFNDMGIQTEIIDGPTTTTLKSNAVVQASNGPIISGPAPSFPLRTESGTGLSFGGAVNGNGSIQFRPSTPEVAVAANEISARGEPVEKSIKFPFGTLPAQTASGTGYPFGVPPINGTTPFQFTGSTASIAIPKISSDSGLPNTNEVNAINSDFTFGASSIPPASSGGFNFGVLPVNGSGTFQFSGSTNSEITDVGLASRGGIPRKFLHARRTKKR